MNDILSPETHDTVPARTATAVLEYRLKPEFTFPVVVLRLDPPMPSGALEAAERDPSAAVLVATLVGKTVQQVLTDLASAKYEYLAVTRVAPGEGSQNPGALVVPCDATGRIGRDGLSLAFSEPGLMPALGCSIDDPRAAPLYDVAEIARRLGYSFVGADANGTVLS